jgi:hypothetical protein
MVRHIDSLILVWHIAEIEARNLGSRHIDPPHLFLGLLKIVDLDLEKALAKSSTYDAAAISAEVEALRVSGGVFDDTS